MCTYCRRMLTACVCVQVHGTACCMPPSPLLAASTGAVYFATFKAASRHFDRRFARHTQRAAARKAQQQAGTCAIAPEGSTGHAHEQHCHRGMSTVSQRVVSTEQVHTQAQVMAKQRQEHADINRRQSNTYATPCDPSEASAGQDLGAGGAAAAAFAAAATARVVTGAPQSRADCHVLLCRLHRSHSLHMHVCMQL